MFLAKEEEAAKEMKSISKDAAENAREVFTSAQNQFNYAADHMPGGMFYDVQPSFRFAQADAHLHLSLANSFPRIA